MSRKSLMQLGFPKALYFSSRFIRLDKFCASDMESQLKAELQKRNINIWMLDLIDFDVLRDYAKQFRTLKDFLDSDEGYDIVSTLLKLSLGTEKSLDGGAIGATVNKTRKGQRKCKAPVEI